MERSLCVAALLVSQVAWGQQYKLEKTIPLGGSGGWDYLTADAANRRLYVSHGTEVLVVDTGAEKVIGRVKGMQRIHGIALDGEDGVGFISDGGANQVVEFGLADLGVRKKILVGQNPDAILYDRASKHVFAFNGRSMDVSVVDVASGSVTKTVPLGGKPEFAVSDGQGSVFVNVEDKNEIVQVDAKDPAVKQRWSIAPCDSPSGLAMDRAHERLFSVCDNERMTVLDWKAGKVVATAQIGRGPDAAAFDPGTKLVFSSNGEDGTLTVVEQKGPSQYERVQTVKTAPGARTMVLDETTHRIYLVTADFGPAAPTKAPGQRVRPSIKPGTFKLLVVGP